MPTGAETYYLRGKRGPGRNQECACCPDASDKAKALGVLAEVTRKLELILARDPSLALAPVDMRLVGHGVFADTGTTKTLIEEAKQAIKQGETQTARHLLAGLASEVVEKTARLPLPPTPGAIKPAVPFIDDGKLDKARKSLKTIRATLVIARDLIPLRFCVRRLCSKRLSA